MPDWSDTDARTERVPSGRCLWCKRDPEKADGDPVPLDTGERLCAVCAGDAREWKRTRFVDLLVSPALDATTQTLLLEDWRGLRDRLVDIHGDDDGIKALPTRTSNADDSRIHSDAESGGANSSGA